MRTLRVGGRERGETMLSTSITTGEELARLRLRGSVLFRGVVLAVRSILIGVAILAAGAS